MKFYSRAALTPEKNALYPLTRRWVSHTLPVSFGKQTFLVPPKNSTTFFLVIQTVTTLIELFQHLTLI